MAQINRYKTLSKQLLLSLQRGEHATEIFQSKDMNALHSIVKSYDLNLREYGGAIGRINRMEINVVELSKLRVMATPSKAVRATQTISKAFTAANKQMEKEMNKAASRPQTIVHER